MIYTRTVRRYCEILCGAHIIPGHGTIIAFTFPRRVCTRDTREYVHQYVGI